MPDIPTEVKSSASEITTSLEEVSETEKDITPEYEEFGDETALQMASVLNMSKGEEIKDESLLNKENKEDSVLLD